MTQLGLPEDDAVEALADVLAAGFLAPSGQLILVLYQPDGVFPQSLGAFPRRLGLHVGVLVGLVPVVWTVARGQHRPVGGIKHGLGPNQVQVLSGDAREDRAGVAALVEVVAPPQPDAGTGGQAVAIAGRATGNSREEVAGFGPSVRRRQSGSHQLHVSASASCSGTLASVLFHQTLSRRRSEVSPGRTRCPQAASLPYRPGNELKDTPKVN